MRFSALLLIVSLYSTALPAVGLSGLDANKFRWAETYRDDYKRSTGNAKETSKGKVENSIAEIQAELDSNKGDPEHAKYTARLNKLIAGLGEDAGGDGITKALGDAKSNLYWAKGKIDYALEDPNYGATAANLETAELNLKTARDILFSGKHEEATGEYRELIDLCEKLRVDLDKLKSSFMK